MAIGEICSRDVVIARREESVREAAELMRRHHVGDIVVVEERSGSRVPVGIVTDRDIVVAIVAKGLDPEKLTLGDIVARELTVAQDTLGVAETVELMRSRGIRRVPIIDASGALVGIVSGDDILDLMAEELTALARMVSREQRREAETRMV
jgi:CBS domain-containing protein